MLKKMGKELTLILFGLIIIYKMESGYSYLIFFHNILGQQSKLRNYLLEICNKRYKHFLNLKANRNIMYILNNIYSLKLNYVELLTHYSLYQKEYTKLTMKIRKLSNLNNKWKYQILHNWTHYRVGTEKTN